MYKGDATTPWVTMALDFPLCSTSLLHILRIQTSITQITGKAPR